MNFFKKRSKSAGIRFAATFVSLCWMSSISGCGIKVQTDGTSALHVRNYSMDQHVKVTNLSGVMISTNRTNARLVFNGGDGAVAVLNVWASWCPPCRKEGPDYEAISRANKDVQFIGIDTRDRTADALAYMRSNDIKYPSISDPDGLVVQSVSNIVPVSAIPSTVIVDRHGDVAIAITGPADRTTLQDAINDAKKR